ARHLDRVVRVDEWVPARERTILPAEDVDRGGEVAVLFEDECAEVRVEHDAGRAAVGRGRAAEGRTGLFAPPPVGQRRGGAVGGEPEGAGRRLGDAPRIDEAWIGEWRA